MSSELEQDDQEAPRNKGGRPKGVPNKLTTEVKTLIQKAAHKAGGKGGALAYLTKQAKENPKAFLALYGKTLPREMSLELQIAGRDLLDTLNARRQQLADLSTIEGTATEVTENVKRRTRS
jgi:hypothetical protein